MNERSPTNVVSMEEWKKKALKKITPIPKQETVQISKEELRNTIKEYILHYLRPMLSRMQNDLKEIEDLQKTKEQEAGKIKITWDQEVLDQNEKNQSRIRELEEHISRGEFLLTREDIEAEDVKEYLKPDIKSLWQGIESENHD